MSVISPIELLDTTVLSNFALVNSTYLLPFILGKKASSTIEVISEFEQGIQRHRLPPTDLTWLNILPLSFNEQLTSEQLKPRLGAGERTCIALAAHRRGRVFTDDSLARKIAAELRVPVSGTLGLLVWLVIDGYLQLTQSDQLLSQMVQTGYRSPVKSISQLI